MTVVFTVYGQVVIKFRILQADPVGDSLQQKVMFLVKLLLDPWIISSFFGAFLASLCWMAAMTRLPMSLAYPFTSLAFVLVTIVGIVFFREEVRLGQTIGIGFVILGLIVIARA
nr:SMR family transporter [uncultured Dongia sp.]